MASNQEGSNSPFTTPGGWSSFLTSDYDFGSEKSFGSPEKASSEENPPQEPSDNQIQLAEAPLPLTNQSSEEVDNALVFGDLDAWRDDADFLLQFGESYLTEYEFGYTFPMPAAEEATAQGSIDLTGSPMDTSAPVANFLSQEEAAADVASSPVLVPSTGSSPQTIQGPELPNSGATAESPIDIDAINWDAVQDNSIWNNLTSDFQDLTADSRTPPEHDSELQSEFEQAFANLAQAVDLDPIDFDFDLDPPLTLTDDDVIVRRSPTPSRAEQLTEQFGILPAPLFSQRNAPTAAVQVPQPLSMVPAPSRAINQIAQTPFQAGGAMGMPVHQPVGAPAQQFTFRYPTPAGVQSTFPSASPAPVIPSISRNYQASSSEHKRKRQTRDDSSDDEFESRRKHRRTDDRRSNKRKTRHDSSASESGSRRNRRQRRSNKGKARAVSSDSESDSRRKQRRSNKRKARHDSTDSESESESESKSESRRKRRRSNDRRKSRRTSKRSSRGHKSGSESEIPSPRGAGRTRQSNPQPQPMGQPGQASMNPSQEGDWYRMTQGGRFVGMFRELPAHRQPAILDPAAAVAAAAAAAPRPAAQLRPARASTVSPPRRSERLRNPAPAARRRRS
ncbi:hypothetical protein ABEF93_002771 [Exophiala dermatitidis]